MRPAVVRVSCIYVLRCNKRRLKALVRYAELADSVEKWMGG